MAASSNIAKTNTPQFALLHGMPTVLGTPLRIGTSISFIECMGNFTAAIANKPLQTGILKRVVAPGVYELLYDNNVVRYKLEDLKPNQYLVFSGPEVVPELRVGMSVLSVGQFVVVPAVVVRCHLSPDDAGMYSTFSHSGGEKFVWYGRIEQVFAKGASVRVPASINAAAAEVATDTVWPAPLPPSTADPSPTDDDAPIPTPVAVAVPPVYQTIGLNRMELRHAINIPDHLVNIEFFKKLESHIKQCVDLVPGDQVSCYPSIIAAATRSSSSGNVLHKCTVREYCYQMHDLVGARLLLDLPDGRQHWAIALQVVATHRPAWPTLHEQPPCKAWRRATATGIDNQPVCASECESSDAPPTVFKFVSHNGDTVGPGAVVVLDKRAWNVVGNNSQSVMLRQHRIAAAMHIPDLGRTKFDDADTETSTGKWICYRIVSIADLQNLASRLSSASLSMDDGSGSRKRKLGSSSPTSTLDASAVGIIEFLSMLQDDDKARSSFAMPIEAVVDSLTGHYHFDDGLPLVKGINNERDCKMAESMISNIVRVSGDQQQDQQKQQAQKSVNTSVQSQPAKRARTGTSPAASSETPERYAHLYL
jgi:hypothetical protein